MIRLKALARRLGSPPVLIDDLSRERQVRVAQKALKTAGVPGGADAHGLPSRLLVSLTSYPPRFRTLHLTLRSLLQQTVHPDALLLWVARDDLPKLPREVTRLVDHGLTIRACDDLRSYKKLVFVLEEHPDPFIVTADDDNYYPPDWLRILVDEVEAGDPAVLCHRANRMKWLADGHLAPYDQWLDDVQDEKARTASIDLLPIGVGGVLYPPNSLAEETIDRALFMKLAPDTDDLWFYCMARRAGTCHRKVGGPFPRVTWRGTQRGHLFERNQHGGNDRQIATLIATFGASDHDPANFWTRPLSGAKPATRHDGASATVGSVAWTLADRRE